MKRIICSMPVFGVVAIMGLRAGAAREDEKTGSPGQITQMTYFKLKDNSDSNRQKMVDACKKYLDRHVGTVYFAAGVIDDEFKSKANDRDWDVAVHLVFKDKVAHDKFREHPRRKQFIDENKNNIAKVRVFNAIVK